MILAIILAGLYLMALAISGGDPVAGQSVFAICQASLGLVALGFGPTRRAALTALGHYWIAALAFAAAWLWTAWQSGLLGAPASALNPFAAQTEVWSFAAVFFAILTPLAIAGSVGRRPPFEALLVAILAFAALDISRKLQAGPEQTLLATTHETACVYALACVFAAFAAYDAVRSPSRDRADRRISMRIMLPGAALGAAVLGLVLCNEPMALGAMLAGLAATGLALALREWPRGLCIVDGAAGLAAAGLAGALFGVFGKEGDRFGLGALTDSYATSLKSAFGLGSGAEGGPVLTWLVEGGIWGATALTLALVALVLRLALSGDRRQTPSRGLALAVGALVTALLSGSGGLSPAAATLLAMSLGLAASYADRLRTSQQSTRAARARKAEGDKSTVAEVRAA